MEIIGINLSELWFALVFMILDSVFTGLVVAGVLILVYYLYMAKGKQGERKSADREQDSR